MNAPNDAPVVHHKAYLFHRCERPFIVVLILALTSVQIKGKISVDDPYGLFSGLAYRNHLYDKLGQYCSPEFSFVCSMIGVEDGPLALLWSIGDLDGGGEQEATCNFLFDDQVFPTIESYSEYSGASSDLPSWLRLIADSVNSPPQSNTTLGDAFTAKYTWFVDDTLLREKCVYVFDENTYSCTWTATTFQPTGESKFLVYQSNSSTEGANLRTVVYEKMYSSETGVQLTQRLLCCGISVASPPKAFVLDYFTTKSLTICTPSMCSPATAASQNCSDMTLALVWKYTLATLAKNVVGRIRAIVQEPFPLVQYNGAAFAKSPKNYPYKFNDVLSLLVEGSGNRTAQNLIYFFEQRERSTSNHFLDVSIHYSHVTSLPNHCWDMNTFMGIIENATAQFRDTAPEKPRGVMNDKTTAWPPLHDDYYETMNLERPIADALLHSIWVLRENNWIEHTSETTNVNPTNLSLPTDSVTPYWLSCLYERHPTELLDGSKCGKAINATLHLSSKLPLSPTDYSLAEQRQGYVFFVGALVITLSLFQTAIRYQWLPGGCLFERDKSRVKRRQEQRSIVFARQQGQEVLGLLKVASQRDANLPPDIQFKQRKISQYFAMSGHILLTLVGPWTDLDGYVNFECGLLFMNLLQSLLEIKAYKLVEQQQHSGTEPAQVGVCIEHSPQARKELAEGQNLK